ncbi:MAG TPA: acetylxylan esterase [Rhodocyclaceae bacterium]|nr:acetylxylan esterase [Rhodocyclaceae bacterium]
MKNQQVVRDRLYSLLGDLPIRHRSISASTTSTVERDGYVLESLILDLNGIEPVPACFAKPIGARGKLPLIIFHHSHGSKYALGKDELIDGNPGILLEEPYAIALTRAGYAVLCIDAWCFGERSHTSELDTFKAFLWQGISLWGMMMYDALRALDYAHMRSDVDTARIGTMGMSMGCTVAWWLAALDERIKVCADMCCLVDYQTLLETKRLSKHGIYYYVPGILKHFNSSDILGLIAPRPHLACVGEHDQGSPIEGVEKIDKHLRQLYAQADAPQAWQLRRYDCGHQEIPPMRGEILDFLKHWM